MSYMIYWILIGMVLIVIKLFMIHCDVKLTLKTFNGIMTALVTVQEITKSYSKENKNE